jgi:class 3 adenylate cyclase
MNSFYALIDQLIHADPARRAVLEEVIWATYGVEQAVLTLDMTHFSLTVRRKGVLHYLTKIRRMHLVTEPIVRAHNGHVVKYEADNMMAVFPDCDSAVLASIEINRAFIGEPLPHEDAGSIGVAIGIDFGQFLYIKSTDCYGDAVNRAFKLGEDLANESEVLITQEVRDRLSPDLGVTFEPEKFVVSGLELPAYRVSYDKAKKGIRA